MLRFATLRSLTLSLTLLASACQRVERGPETYAFEGPTMSTTFTVKVVAERLNEGELLLIQRVIDLELEAVNQKMSHYDEDSELSRFNRSRDMGPFPVSEETLEVFRHAQEVSALTGGAFDITAGPLVNLWGFGPDGRPETLPSEMEIARARDRSGYAKLVLDLEDLTIRKTEPFLYCDLSAIAKGFAVDRVAEALESEGLGDYMVEVGGEVRTGGNNESGKDWRIAIELPEPGPRAIQRIIPLSGLAMATSGGYRNFYEVDGVRFSHTIDPRTGRPIAHGLAAVSVVDELCVRADALATGLLVLGSDEGYRLAVENDIAALFLIAEDGGAFRELATPAFDAFQKGVK